MPKDYTITVSDEVEAALQKVALVGNITSQAVIEAQLDYYIACSLYDHFRPNSPINTSELSISERLEVYAVMVNSSEQAARDTADALITARDTIDTPPPA